MSAVRDVLVVTVYGKPVTQGSKTRTRWGMRDDNADRLRPWREAVKTAALDALCGAVRREGPVAVAGDLHVRPAEVCAPYTPVLADHPVVR